MQKCWKLMIKFFFLLPEYKRIHNMICGILYSAMSTESSIRWALSAKMQICTQIWIESNPLLNKNTLFFLFCWTTKTHQVLRVHIRIQIHITFEYTCTYTYLLSSFEEYFYTWKKCWYKIVWTFIYNLWPHFLTL